MSYLGSNWGHMVTVDFIGLFCGALLAEGQYRKVYEHAQSEELVLKVELGAGSFCNVAEWELWHNLKATKTGALLAPCVAISPCGTVLIQRRTEAVGKRALPKKLPGIFCDLKPENWGVLEGKVVCHDYGNHRSFILAGRSRVRKARWRTGKTP